MDPRTARKAAGLTLVQVAEQIGASHAQVSKFETGHNFLRVPKMLRYAEVTGMTELADALRPLVAMQVKPGSDVAA